MAPRSSYFCRKYNMSPKEDPQSNHVTVTYVISCLSSTVSSYNENRVEQATTFPEPLHDTYIPHPLSI